MKGNFKTPEKWQAVLEEHFSYLPKEERNKMICGDEFRGSSGKGVGTFVHRRL